MLTMTLWSIIVLTLSVEETEAQRSRVTCPRSHSEWAVESGFNFRSADATSHSLSYASQLPCGWFLNSRHWISPVPKLLCQLASQLWPKNYGNHILLPSLCTSSLTGIWFQWQNQKTNKDSAQILVQVWSSSPPWSWFPLALNPLPGPHLLRAQEPGLSTILLRRCLLGHWLQEKPHGAGYWTETSYAYTPRPIRARVKSLSASCFNTSALDCTIPPAEPLSREGTLPGGLW